MNINRANYPYITAIWPSGVPTYRDARECIVEWLTGIDIVVLKIVSRLKACDHSECIPQLGLCTCVTKALLADGSTAQFDWFHRVCRIAPSDKITPLYENIAGLDWLYAHGYINVDSASTFRTGNMDVYKWGVARMLKIELNDDRNAEEIIKHMQHDASLRYKMIHYQRHAPDDVIVWICERVIARDPMYTDFAFGTRAIKIACMRGYLPKMVDLPIHFHPIPIEAAEILVNAKIKRGIAWWLQSIAHDDDELMYPRVAAFLDKIAESHNTGEITGDSSYMPRHATRWCIENGHKCHITGPNIPVETVLAYIDYVQNHIEVSAMCTHEVIPVVEALVARGTICVLSNVQKKRIAGCATATQLSRLGICGKKYLRFALGYNNVSALDYLYAHTLRTRPLTWSWFMNQSNGMNYEWIRRNVPRPRYAIFVMRRFDAALLVKLREDKVTVFLHAGTSMSHRDAEWLMRN